MNIFYDFMYDLHEPNNNLNNNVNIDELITFTPIHVFNDDSDDNNDNDENNNDNDENNNDNDENNDKYDSDEETEEEYEEENKKKEDTFDYENFFHTLLNTFMLYFNEKFNKKETFFSNINNNTNPQMELFYESIFNFTKYKDKNNLDSEEILSIIYDKEEYNNKNIEHDELYCLDIEPKKLYSPFLINCLNYIVKNDIKEWKIYNLKQY
jgi:hypothetical protein